MGAEVESSTYSPSERSRYRERLEDSLRQLRQYLQHGDFSETAVIGLELELNLIDQEFRPAPVNAAVLAELDDPAFQAELGRFTIELNHPTVRIAGDGLVQVEESLRHELASASEAAATRQAHVLPIGILPTVTGEDLSGHEWISDGNRFKALNQAILGARGEDILIDVEGTERLAYYARDIAAEATCTSMQIHLEVTRERFGLVWNAAQALAGAQVALAANSPFFLGTQLWAETRIPVFQQSIDDRAPEYARQGVRPRVWFGERWVDGIEDLFEENVAYFPALLPEQSDGPRMSAQGVPLLPELNLHNGTVYRWNRPIFDPGSDESPANLRVENRLLPAGPTAMDMTANIAFFFGAVKYLVDSGENPWDRMSFSAARENFFRCAQEGLKAEVYWPGFGDVPVTELLDRFLLPSARKGLEMFDVAPTVIDRYIEVLTGRTRTGQNGSSWMVRCLAQLEQQGMPRGEALRTLTKGYLHNSQSGDPVHTWSLTI